MKKTPIIEVDGKSKGLVCMDCGKSIKEMSIAPSGSLLPRCGECNAKRWKQFRESKTEGYGIRGWNEPDPLEDPWG